MVLFVCLVLVIEQLLSVVLVLQVVKGGEKNSIFFFFLWFNKCSNCSAHCTETIVLSFRYLIIGINVKRVLPSSPCPVRKTDNHYHMVCTSEVVLVLLHVVTGQHCKWVAT